jgi:hypothetical protein
LLPHLRLDDLLAELQVRLAAAVKTQNRVHALLEAVVAVGANLELEVALRQIVEVAVALVNARYGALGVIGEGGRLAEFVLAPRRAPAHEDLSRRAGVDPR